jgi:hypothetical protein
MVNLYSKIDCYLCDEKVLGRDIGSTLGSGFFTYNVCKKCTHENYCWATPDDLITDWEKQTKKLERKINKIMLELGGILSL